MYKMKLQVPGGAELEVTGDSQQDLFKQAAFFQSLPLVCPIDGTPTRLEYRTPGGYKYYSVVSTGVDGPYYEYKLGVHEDGSGLFPHGKWVQYDMEQQREVVLWEKGKFVNGAGPSKPVPNVPEPKHVTPKSVPNGKPPSKYGDTPAQPDQAETGVELFGPDAWQMSKAQRGTLMALGMALYENKEEWDTRRHMAVKHITRNRTTSSNELTEAEYHKLIFNLEKKVREKVIEMITELYPDSNEGVVATLIEYHTGSDKSAGVRDIREASGVMLANAVKSLREEEAKALANEVGAELEKVEEIPF